MALISNSKGRKEGGGYERLFGNKELGHLLSRVQATIISSGTELEKIIIDMSKKMDNLDEFLEQQDKYNGIFLISKQVIKKSILRSDKEPYLLVLKIDKKKRHCYIIELKDGDNFDTKKAAGEIITLQKFQNQLSRKIQFTTSIHICSFNQPNKEKIVSGFKKKISLEQAMTGEELCNLLEIKYQQIINIRKKQQNENLLFFIKELLKIEEIKKIILSEI